MFTAEHFIWIGLCAVFVIGMCLVSRKKLLTLRRAGYIMTAICALSEVSKVMSNLLKSAGGGMHLDPLCLPFHLCSLMIFAVLYITFGGEGKFKRLLINFVAVMGTLGSFCAIMIPTNGTDFASVLSYQCFVYHAGLMWFSLHLIITGETKLGSLGSFAANFGMLLALAFLMLYVNGALSVYDTNFFYLTRPPMEGLPFLNLGRGWHVYFLRLLALGTSPCSTCPSSSASAATPADTALLPAAAHPYTSKKLPAAGRCRRRRAFSFSYGITRDSVCPSPRTR